jgi:glycerophosphoryl diester phosphodiesterase
MYYIIAYSLTNSNKIFNLPTIFLEKDVPQHISLLLVANIVNAMFLSEVLFFCDIEDSLSRRNPRNDHKMKEVSSVSQQEMQMVMPLHSPLSRVAHRGGSLLAPENTLAAFRQALTLPVDAVELDVQITSDGHAVVFHDNTVDRLTEGIGNILDLKLSDLRSLNAAANFSGEWPQREIIPTLREVLALLNGHKQVYIEAKNSRRDDVYGRYPRIAEIIVEEVRAAGMLQQVVVVSFDWQILADVKSLTPELSLGMVVGREWWSRQSPELVLTTLFEQAVALECQWLNMDYTLFTPAILDAIHEHGLKQGLWTVNTLEELQHFAAAGVDSLTTDRPDLFTHVF